MSNEPTPSAAPIEPVSPGAVPVVEPKETLLATPKEPAKEAEAPKPAKVVPEKYELKLPEHTLLSEAHLEKIATFAKEHGFSQEEAASLLKRDNLAMAEFAVNYEKSFLKGGTEWTKQMDAFEAQAIADKEIGGSIENLKASAELSRRVIQRFDTKDGALAKMVSESPIGSNPEVIRFLTKIGKAMSEDKTIWGEAKGAAPKSHAETLYGDSQ